MPYARKDGVKRWVADAWFTRADGVELRLHRTYDTKDEAKRAEQWFKMTGELLPGQSVPAHAFSEVAERFKAKTPEWFKTHDGRTNAHRWETCVSYFGKMDIKTVRFAQIEDFIEYLRTKRPVVKKGVKTAPANRTLRKYVDALFLILRYALRLELIPGLPDRPEIANTGQERTSLSWDQEHAIVRALEAEGRTVEAFVVRLLAATGMRCGELWKLAEYQIELPERREHTGVMLRVEQTKTHAARWVPIVPEGARKLKLLLASNSIPNRKQVYKHFKRALEICGEDPRLTLHCLRHTTVTRLRESGADFLDIAEIVGHTTGKMTSGYYHPDKAHLFTVAEKVQQFCGEEHQSATVVPLINLQKSA